jgi:Predicted membrane protein (DUF2232)
MYKNISINVAFGAACSAFMFLTLAGNGGSEAHVNPLQALFLMILSVIPLFLAGLGWWLFGGIVAVVTTGVINAAFIDPLYSLTYALTCGLPVLVLTRQALLWRKESNDTSWYPAANLFGVWVCVSIALSYMALLVLYMGPELRAMLADQFSQIMVQFQKQGGINTTITAEEFVWLMPQFFGLFWGVILMIGGCIAQALLSRFKLNLRPTPEFSGVELPRWVGIGWIALVTFDLAFDIATPLIGPIVVIVGFAFLLQGLAVIHRVSRSWNYRSAILAAVYLIMILMFWPILVIALLGLVDSWVGFRGRPTTLPNQEED